MEDIENRDPNVGATLKQKYAGVITTKFISKDGAKQAYKDEIDLAKETFGAGEFASSLLHWERALRILIDNDLGDRLVPKITKKIQECKANITNATDRLAVQREEEVLLEADKFGFQESESGDYVWWGGQTLKISKRTFGRLMDHQKDGISFLFRRWTEGQGGLLAHDMGLGKTIQAIVFASTLLACRKVRTVLVITPKPVIAKWEQEWRKWGVGSEVLNTDELTGAKLERQLEIVMRKGGVVLITFEKAHKNVPLLNGNKMGRSHRWDLVLCDETHKLKNMRAATTKSLSQINSKVRYGLTGTPFQNNPMDVFAITSWVTQGSLLPDMDEKEFNRTYSEPIARGREKTATEQQRAVAVQLLGELRELLRPIIQVRKKCSFKVIPDWLEKSYPEFKQDPDKWVHLELPPKTEVVLFTSISTNIQEAVYESFLDSDLWNKWSQKNNPLVAIRVMQQVLLHPALSRLSADSFRAVLESSAGGGGFGGDGTGRKAMVHIDTQVEKVLEKKALDVEEKGGEWDEQEWEEARAVPLPEPVDLDSMEIDELVSQSGKLQVLRQLLPSLHEHGHRVILFSQFRRFLNLVGRLLDSMGYKYYKMTGETEPARRTEMVRSFNSHTQYFAFMATVRVGGEGIDLTGADAVIIADPHWNPCVDAQAVDRSYRIGQTKSTRVFRLVTTGTIEEKMYMRQIYKLGESRAILEQNDTKSFFDREDMKVLFSAGNTKESLVQKRMSERQAWIVEKETDEHLDTLIGVVSAIEGVTGHSRHDLLAYMKGEDLKSVGNAGYDEASILGAGRGRGRGRGARTGGGGARGGATRGRGKGQARVRANVLEEEEELADQFSKTMQMADQQEIPPSPEPHPTHTAKPSPAPSKEAHQDSEEDGENEDEMNEEVGDAGNEDEESSGDDWETIRNLTQARQTVPAVEQMDSDDDIKVRTRVPRRRIIESSDDDSDAEVNHRQPMPTTPAPNTATPRPLPSHHQTPSTPSTLAPAQTTSSIRKLSANKTTPKTTTPKLTRTNMETDCTTPSDRSIGRFVSDQSPSSSSKPARVQAEVEMKEVPMENEQSWVDEEDDAEMEEDVFENSHQEIVEEPEIEPRKSAADQSWMTIKDGDQSEAADGSEDESFVSVEEGDESMIADEMTEGKMETFEENSVSEEQNGVGVDGDGVVGDGVGVDASILEEELKDWREMWASEVKGGRGENGSSSGYNLGLLDGEGEGDMWEDVSDGNEGTEDEDDTVIEEEEEGVEGMDTDEGDMNGVEEIEGEKTEVGMGGERLVPRHSPVRVAVSEMANEIIEGPQFSPMQVDQLSSSVRQPSDHSAAGVTTEDRSMNQSNGWESTSDDEYGSAHGTPVREHTQSESPIFRPLAIPQYDQQPLKKSTPASTNRNTTASASAHSIESPVFASRLQLPHDLAPMESFLNVGTLQTSTPTASTHQPAPHHILPSSMGDISLAQTKPQRSTPPHKQTLPIDLIFTPTPEKPTPRQVTSKLPTALLQLSPSPEPVRKFTTKTPTATEKSAPPGPVSSLIGGGVKPGGYSLQSWFDSMTPTPERNNGGGLWQNKASAKAIRTPLRPRNDDSLDMLNESMTGMSLAEPKPTPTPQKGTRRLVLSDSEDDGAFEREIAKIKAEKAARESAAMSSDEDEMDSFIVPDDEIEMGGSGEEDDLGGWEESSDPFDFDISDGEPSVAPTPSRLPNTQTKPPPTTTKKSAMKAASKNVLRAAAVEMFADFNKRVFDNRLPSDMEVRWSNTLNTTAGRCHFKGVSNPANRQAIIELSSKVLDNVERLRDTLAHEMCHAAAWLIDGNLKPPHGDIFKKWARHFHRCYPQITVTTTHSYVINFKHEYKCVEPQCGKIFGRHSKLKDMENRLCGRCGGRLEKLNDKPRKLNAFAIFTQQNYGPVKRETGGSHKEVLATLRAMYQSQKPNQIEEIPSDLTNRSEELPT